MTLARGWKTAVVVGAGPSLDREQADYIAAAHAAGVARVVVVNESWRLIPTADVVYAADGAWYLNIAQTPPESGALCTPGVVTIEALRRHFRGELWTQQRGMVRINGGDREQWADAAPRLGIKVVRSEMGSGIHADPDAVYTGGNSGHQAICLAHLFGARRIVLSGFDMQRSKGREHWHGPHAKLADGNPDSFVKHFDTLAPQLAAAGVIVKNSSRETALTCFPRVDLRDAL